MIFTNLVQGNLNTQFLGRHIEYYPFTDSTNDDVWELVNENEIKNGSIIITDDQRNGKGRQNNQWHSSPGQNLTFSFLLLPEIDIQKIGLISLVAGVGVCEAIKDFCLLDCQLKWPNDILLNGKKVGGILIESKKIEKTRHLCIGIGLNVNSDLSLLPAEIQENSSALTLEKGHPLQLEPLLATILNKIENNYLSHLDNITEKWQTYCAHNQSEVQFNYGREKISGKFLGINEFGYAKIDTGTKIETFPGGELVL